MAFIIPLRCVTAIAGLLIGYYVGDCYESYQKNQLGVQKITASLQGAYEAARKVAEMIDDMDDDCAEIDFDTTDSSDSTNSDSDTDYSDEAKDK